MIRPSLPQRLRPLSGLARNLWWAWHPDAVTLFTRMDPELWEETKHNPVKLLGQISQARLEQLAEDDGFTTHLDRVIYGLSNYMESGFWFQKSHGKRVGDVRFAYFSAEFGISESLPIYSGGLGILAGDHLKSASDLGLPLVGVGLLYQSGYFQQYLNQDGWQQETYPENDFYNMPVFLEKDDNGHEIVIDVDYPGRKVYARVWRCQVGRTPLFLLDANIPENSTHDRTITHQLYGGDIRMRIEQELLLGIGGVRALAKVGIKATVFHMNEGHSAFLALERIRNLQADCGLSLPEAKEAVISSSVFTTHTPVPAGNDIFSPELVNEYLGGYVGSLGMNMNELLRLGRQVPGDLNEPFCMTVLAMRLSSFTNGVSELHSQVSKKMWAKIYDGLDVKDVPIRAITNGVHIRSWLSEEMWGLFDRYLGQQWVEDPANDAVWRRIKEIPDSELWRTHERRRERLVGFSRKWLRKMSEKRGETGFELKRAEEILRPDALTIGFARRFATYKRAGLLFADIDRLKKIVNNADRPVQFVIAGKAHPKDNAGKSLIKNIVHAVRDEDLRDSIVFLENYDISMARYMVQGVDVWLNNPRRPMEASGTSGMKASANGALNFSVLDGWWDEGYTPETGWAIGSGEEYEGEDGQREQDLIDSRAIYDLLEKEIVPLFYDRGKDDMPRGWISKMKSSLSSLNLVFNTNRMVRNYTSYFYLPCASRWGKLTADNYDRLKKLSEWKQNMYGKWNSVGVERVFAEDDDDLKVGNMLSVSAHINTGGLAPDDLKVELYYGIIDVSTDELMGGDPAPMTFLKNEDGRAIFQGSIPLTESGRQGFAVRVMPSNDDMFDRIEPGLVKWS